MRKNLPKLQSHLVFRLLSHIKTCKSIARSTFFLPGKQGRERDFRAKAFVEVVLEMILEEKKSLQHNLGSVYVEKVNIVAELVNLNNVENQTGSFRL